MSFVTRQAAHCDQCSHEWLVVSASTPKHCAKCKSRRWNNGGDSSVVEPRTHNIQDIGSNQVPRTKPTMQDLRDICAGKGSTFQTSNDVEKQEVPICGKRWWEDGIAIGGAEANFHAAPKPQHSAQVKAALRAICAGQVDAAVGIDSNSKIGGCPSVEIMRNDVKSPTAFDGEAAPNLCSHKEWAEDGEQYRCRLQAGHRGKCAPGERVS